MSGYPLLLLALFTPLRGGMAMPDVYEHVFHADDAHPRKGEGDIIVLRDGRLLLTYTEFYEGGTDHSPARIMATISEDDGEMWSEPYVLQENVGGCNVMSVSFLRLNADEIALFYLVKNHPTRDCRVYMKRSSDEGQTWSEPVLVTADEGYFVLNNARVIRASTGRIIVPVSTYRNPETFGYWKSLVYYSDDGGRSWRRGKGEVALPDEVESRVGLQEPGVIELKDGRLMMYMRTGLGYVYRCYSKDQGETWSEPEPLDELKAPTSPVTIARMPSTGDLIVIWNDKGKFDLSGLSRRGADIIEGNFQRRAPLSIAISEDDSLTWRKVMDLEPTAISHYPSIDFKGEYVFITYYYQGHRHLKFVRMKVAELYSRLR